MRWMVTVCIAALFVGSAWAEDAEVDAPRDFDAYWKTERDPAVLQVKFANVITRARAKGNYDAEYIVEAMTQLARTHAMRKAFDKAHEILDAAAKELGEKKCVAQVRLHLERGRSHNSAGEREKASEHFQKALKLAEELGAHYHAIDAMHMLGISEPPEKSLEWNLKAIKAAENAKGERARNWRGALYNNTGWTYFEAGDYEKALLYFRSNVAFRQEVKSDDRTGRYCVGKALRMLKRYDEALTIQRKLEAEGKPTGFVLEELGELLWATGDKEAAKGYLKKAYDVLSKISWVASQKERMDGIREKAGLPKPKEETSDEEKAADEVDDGE